MRTIPEGVVETAIRDLRAALRHMGREELAPAMLFAVKGKFLYVYDVDGEPVCRLKYVEGSIFWDLQMYLPHDDRYDTRRETLTFAGGTLSECIEAALDAFEA